VHHVGCQYDNNGLVGEWRNERMNEWYCNKPRLTSNEYNEDDWWGFSQYKTVPGGAVYNDADWGRWIGVGLGAGGGGVVNSGWILWGNVKVQIIIELYVEKGKKG